jgi:para-aminobenzoate synthetase component I
VDAQQVKTLMNEWGAAGVPYLFIIDLEQKKPLVFKLSEIDNNDLLFDVQSQSNAQQVSSSSPATSFGKSPETFEVYSAKFDRVCEHIHRGDTYLLNLTCFTPVIFDLALRDLFYSLKAKYKLWLRDQFICFSPETFVRIADGKIYSHPMKGTIGADVPNAEAVLLNDEKELAEHYTIVDLIRNDLSMVAEHVRVDKFRYIDRLQTNQRDLLQVSSIISGELPANYLSCIGDIIFALLPAGSVTGAPKARTMEIIREVEDKERGYYTGIFGLFDGKSLDSAVMIRYIEETNEGLVFRSGGGITTYSNAESEYQEMIDKVYVPLR